VDFLLLGPLEVIGDRGEPVPVTWPARKALLAVLLLYAGEPCSHGLLIDAVWGARTPKHPVLSLRSHISRLRTEVGLGSRLQATGREDAKTLDAAAYLLKVGDGELDLHRFRQRAARGRQLLARGELEAAAPALAAALGCWREPPLANLPSSPLIDAEAEALLEERRAAEADYVDVMLALGRHREVLADLRRTTTIDPLAEGPAGQLMLALDRAGRKTEALAAYSHTRGAVIQALGTDPSPYLEQLHLQILGDSPALAGPLWPAPAGAAVGGLTSLLRPATMAGPGRHMPR
jgi:DNA-binding SARP family transcriptional activator